MAKLEELLKSMDKYDWDSVEDYEENWTQNYSKLISKTWKDELKINNIKLKGKVLDVCCGPVSLSYLHEDTIGYDKSPKCIKSVREWGYDGILGDLRKTPFDDKEFDQTICFFPPFNPYGKSLKPTRSRSDRYVDIVVSEMFRVTKKEIFVCHSGFVDFAPKKFDKYVKKKEGFHLHYKL